jgi:DNA-binding CsgD family transcriptional regulator
MPDRRPPLVVVEGSPAAMTAASAELVAGGWLLTDGFGGGRRPGPSVRCGPVADRAGAEAALLTALGGEGLLVHALADRDVIDRLVDDLRRLGPVAHRIGDPIGRPPVPTEARAILGLLAEGHSLGEAAAILGLSRRTADRRLAEGRRALGTERTTEAIARARDLGWLGRDDHGT